VTVANRKEMAILESTEMRNCDPNVLINFFGIAWRQSSFCGESKFGHGIGKHLFWV